MKIIFQEHLCSIWKMWFIQIKKQLTYPPEMVSDFFSSIVFWHSQMASDDYGGKIAFFFKTISSETMENLV